jgi:hypothetical protein
MKCCCADYESKLGKLPVIKGSPAPRIKNKYNYYEKNGKALWEVNNPAENETFA